MRKAVLLFLLLPVVLLSGCASILAGLGAAQDASFASASSAVSRSGASSDAAESARPSVLPSTPEGAESAPSNAADAGTPEAEIAGEYEYAEGQFLSRFTVSETDGVKSAALMFWHNYGASASDEDFFFTWEDGKRQYSVLGNRSGKQFALCFTPTETGLRISVVCEEGAYYSWTAGQADEVWSDAEYTAE